jgi:class 3 adenylate cyclase
VREPSQVFILLETLYSAFDAIAARRGVFKIETIGDCYVAVTGLPKPQKHHAVIMARFAADCREKMNVLTRELEVTLGPDTGDLKLRLGLHSGPVTAGVLRGQKARFQLFGDTGKRESFLLVLGSCFCNILSVSRLAFVLFTCYSFS